MDKLKEQREKEYPVIDKERLTEAIGWCIMYLLFWLGF